MYRIELELEEDGHPLYEDYTAHEIIIDGKRITAKRIFARSLDVI